MNNLWLYTAISMNIFINGDNIMVPYGIWGKFEKEPGVDRSVDEWLHCTYKKNYLILYDEYDDDIYKWDKNLKIYL